MNEVFRTAAETARLGWIMGVLTVLFLGSFLFWWWWAYSSGNRARHEAASRLPLSDDGSER